MRRSHAAVPPTFGGGGLTRPTDITDPKFVKAYAHPLRIRILDLLDGRVASPSELAVELDAPLSNTSYHVRQLATLGLVDLVRRTARRGAIEHYYTAVVRPTITDDGWARLPEIVKRAHMGGILQTAIAHIVAAAETGGWDRPDSHYSRTPGRLDTQGWHDASAALSDLLKRLDTIFEESEARLETDPTAEWEDATVLMMMFAGPSARTLPPRAAARRRERERARKGPPSESLEGLPPEL
jgi:DNA-binding transcriptional ArsR family regulator